MTAPGVIRSRKLARCEGCGVALALCFCSELPRVATTTRVVLVMHAFELPKTTNTGRLVLRMLENSELRVRGGKHFGPVPPPPAGRRLVLFPLPGARELAPSDAGRDLTLVVPDGSYAQARRMLRRDGNVKGAEAVRLPSGPSSRYGLRRSPNAAALSTLEAVARALALLEGPELEARLLPALELLRERVLRMRESRFGDELR